MNIDLRRCRENAGMSQAKVASILDISEAEVSHYEQQSDKVPPGLLVKIVNEEFWLKDEKGKQIIDLLLLDDQERCEQYCLQAGSFDILQKYGVHGSNEDIAAHAAVVYMDSPLLRACNLIDLPGYSDKPDEDSKDGEKANTAARIANVLLYASPARGHINGQDMSPSGSPVAYGGKPAYSAGLTASASY